MCEHIARSPAMRALRAVAGDSVVNGTLRRRVNIHGHVQGVFFRDTTRRRAAERGVSGWVRNTPEGTVEAVFEGPPDAVESMLSFAREGPRGAVVERVEVVEEEPEGLTGFSVR